MRTLPALSWLLTAALVSADPAPEKPLPPPLLLQHSLWDDLPDATRTTVDGTVVVLGGAAGLVGAFWGLGNALSRLSDPGGPPVGTTAAGLAWGTVGLAAAGVALEALLTAR